MNPIYNIWNYDFIQQQAQQQYHMSQVAQVVDSAHKLKDFLDSLDKIDSPYQNMATAEFCAVLSAYMQKHSRND